MSETIEPGAFLDPETLAPAMAARRSRLVTVGGRAKGSVATVRETVRRYACECQLDALRETRRIDDRQWQAGMRFRGTWRRTRRGERVTADYGSVGCGRSMSDEISKGAEEAELEVSEARTWMPPMHWCVLTAVAGENEDVGNDRRMLLLRNALDILATQWGIVVVVEMLGDIPEPENERLGRWKKA